MFVDASLLHVEKGGLVELSGGGAVRGFYIVGVDFQLWLGAHFGGVGEKEVPVGLMRFGLLRVRNYFEVSDEVSAAVVIEDEFDELVGCSTAYVMTDVRFSGDGFGAVQESESVDFRGAVFAELGDGDFIGAA